MADAEPSDKRLEIAVNIASLVVMCLLATVLVKSYFFTNRSRPEPSIAVGDKLTLSEALTSGSERAIVLALSTTCHFCSESIPFYRRLSTEAGRTHVPVIAIFPQPSTDVANYLKANGLAGIASESGRILRISGTPTLMLVNRQGVVTKVWRGKLPPEQENEVLSKIGVGS